MAHSTKYNLFWIIVLHPTHLPPVTAHQEYTRTPLCSQEALTLITLSGFISTIKDNTYLMRRIMGAKIPILNTEKENGGLVGMERTQREEKEAETKAEAVAALLPDHMIADRCQGQRRKVACRSGRAQGKVRMSKETARKRGPRGTERGHSAERNTGKDRGHRKTDTSRVTSVQM